VDLAQAAIGPGMAVYTRYSRIVEADGSLLTVRGALALINRVLDEVLAEQEGDFDAETRWAVTWFSEHAFGEAPFGAAESLSKAKNTSVQGLVEAGIVESRAGKVRLTPRDKLPGNWSPATDKRLTIWEATQHLIQRNADQGEEAAGRLFNELGAAADAARELAYRLYIVSERKGWAEEARDYNTLVTNWRGITERAAQAPREQQGRLALSVD